MQDFYLFAWTEILQIIIKHSTNSDDISYGSTAGQEAYCFYAKDWPNYLQVQHWNFKLLELHNQNYQNKTWTNKSK